MIVRNYSPFPSIQFSSRDVKKADFGVSVARGTFRILHGMPVRPIPEQAPLAMADEYYSEPAKSSLRLENSIAPLKPRTDIHVTATAHAPNGNPSTHWPVSVSVGDLKKELYVTGPRYWGGKNNGNKVTTTEPISNLPLRYEHAFGGTIKKGENLVFHKENPIGVGFVDSVVSDPDQPVAIPQIISEADLNPKYGQTISVEGFGPIPGGWAPRTHKAGTLSLIHI